ncbi:MAG: class I SAM-dependent methyltransferase [Solirubrobacteraceae bacterium]
MPLRDDPRLRALVVGTGVARPRTAHSDGEAALLAELARGRRRIVEIGVFEGASAILLCEALDAGAELHLVDPFARQPNARRDGAAATEWATRRVVERAARRTNGPHVQWHVDFSANVAERWTLPLDLVAIDGDPSEIGVTKDWDLWHPFVVEGGTVLFHDARASQRGGRGLSGPTEVVDRLFRGPRALPDWEIADEVDRAVAVRYAPRAA